MILSSYSIDLQFEHRVRDPGEITSALSMDPSRCWSAGSARTGPHGNFLGGFNKQNYWSKIIDSDDFENGGFERALLNLTVRLLPSIDYLKVFSADGGKITLETFWNIGSAWPKERLCYTLLAALGELKIDLALIPVLSEKK